MIRRAVDRVRRSPDWDALSGDAGGFAMSHPLPAPGSPGARKVSTLVAVAGALAFIAWVTLKTSEPSEGGVRTGSKPDQTSMAVDLPPVPPIEPPSFDQATPTDRPLPTTSVPVVAQPPSVGLVGQGEMGGQGNGMPGLDLGLEGAPGEGMAVASGGGGRGNGAGSGVGNGVGSERFVYQLGQVDQDAQPDKIVDPAYPRRAKEDGIEASVELRLLIDEHGRIEQMEVLGAPPGYGFDAALKKSSQQWRFVPAQLGGVPVPQWVRMPYSFHLE